MARIVRPTSPCASCLLAMFACALCMIDSFVGMAVANESRETPVVRAIAKARPSVVFIQGRKEVIAAANRGGIAEKKQVNGMGTGVVIDERGYVLTNYHVVEDVSRIQVKLHDDRTVIATLIDYDPAIDLAVIKLPEEEALPIIDIGTSSDLMLGETVIALGNPYGYDDSVAAGIISCLRRTVQVSDAQNYEDMIQIDAPINPGNSGGPLLNIEGEMIGINAAVRVGAQGIAFAIPVDKAMQVAAKLLSSKTISGISHGVVGATVIEPTQTGFVVSNLRAGSPAASSGLKVGDQVVRVGSRKIERALDFERALIDRNPGESVNVTVRRGGKTIPLSMALGRTTSTVADRSWSVLGLRLSEIPAAAFRNKTTRYRGGLRVEAVRPGSPSSKEGIQAGDILIGIHRWETISLDNMAWILNNQNEIDSQLVKFFILRKSEPLYGYIRIASLGR